MAAGALIYFNPVQCTGPIINYYNQLTLIAKYDILIQHNVPHKMMLEFSVSFSSQCFFFQIGPT